MRCGLGSVFACLLGRFFEVLILLLDREFLLVWVRVLILFELQEGGLPLFIVGLFCHGSIASGMGLSLFSLVIGPLLILFGSFTFPLLLGLQVLHKTKLVTVFFLLHRRNK